MSNSRDRVTIVLLMAEATQTARISIEGYGNTVSSMIVNSVTLDDSAKQLIEAGRLRQPFSVGQELLYEAIQSYATENRFRLLSLPLSIYENKTVKRDLVYPVIEVVNIENVSGTSGTYSDVTLFVEGNSFMGKKPLLIPDYETLKARQFQPALLIGPLLGDLVLAGTISVVEGTSEVIEIGGGAVFLTEGYTKIRFAHEGVLPEAPITYLVVSTDNLNFANLEPNFGTTNDPATFLVLDFVDKFGEAAPVLSTILITSIISAAPSPAESTLNFDTDNVYEYQLGMQNLSLQVLMGEEWTQIIPVGLISAHPWNGSWSIAVPALLGAGTYRLEGKNQLGAAVYSNQFIIA